jgi:bifunctional non-homologous end joining protein LigD
VQIWDRGEWIPEGDPHKGYAKGHLAFRLEGKKLHGGWHLVRMRRKGREKHEPWLLMKANDEFARRPSDVDILDQEPLSVVTGRSIEEIAAGKKPARGSSKSTARTRRAAAVHPSRRSNEHTAPTGRRSALPAFVEPCLALLVDKPPDKPGWVHEIKFDGYRTQARIERGKVKLLTRRGLDWSAKFPAIARALAGIDADTALIDGEIVSEREDGVSDFGGLQQDLKTGRTDRLVYYAFDLLHLDGHSLLKTPLAERKKMLERRVAKLPKGGHVRFSEHFEEPGPKLLDHACRLGLEGIVSKRSEGTYRSGRRGDWLKAKCSDRQEFVVAGYAPSTVDRKAIGALVLAYYDKGKLQYAGRTGTGFTHHMARDLWRRLQSLRRPGAPLEMVPTEEKGREAVWVEPKLVVEVDFHGWTHGNRVRQAAFKGVREDKSAREVVREGATMAPKSRGGKIANPRPAASGSDPRYSVRLTHPDRVYWEDVGLTKLGLADYYASIWKWIAPHLVRRPIALLRCPDGISGECFFQKHASAGLDERVLLTVREKGEKPMFAVGDLDGLIALVQAGVLEIHVWGTTMDRLDSCDRLVFDLDPAPEVAWSAVVAAAREVRARLGELKLESFLKTTGGKGLHVVAPIEPAPWELAKPFARAVAEAMARDAPDRYVAMATKKRRTGRIFVDYLRNGRGATAIVAYSTRARPGASVSVPIAWSELGALTSASRYTVDNLATRLSRLRRDPWADIARLKQRLPRR